MSLIDTLSSDMRQAMKAGNKPLLGVLRLLVSELKYRLIDKSELSRDDEITFLMSEVKKRRDSMEAYKNVSTERFDAEKDELRVIETYLPAQLSDDEILEVVESVMSDNPSLAMGPLMGKVLGQIKQNGDVVDGSRVKLVVEKLLK